MINMFFQFILAETNASWSPRREPAWEQWAQSRASIRESSSKPLNGEGKWSVHLWFFMFVFILIAYNLEYVQGHKWKKKKKNKKCLGSVQARGAVLSMWGNFLCYSNMFSLRTCWSEAWSMAISFKVLHSTFVSIESVLHVMGYVVKFTIISQVWHTNFSHSLYYCTRECLNRRH